MEIRQSNLYSLTMCYLLPFSADSAPVGSVVTILTILDPWASNVWVTVRLYNTNSEFHVRREHLRQLTPLELIALQAD